MLLQKYTTDQEVEIWEVMLHDDIWDMCKDGEGAKVQRIKGRNGSPWSLCRGEGVVRLSDGSEGKVGRSDSEYNLSLAVLNRNMTQ